MPLGHFVRGDWRLVGIDSPDGSKRKVLFRPFLAKWFVVAFVHIARRPTIVLDGTVHVPGVLLAVAPTLDACGVAADLTALAHKFEFDV